MEEALFEKLFLLIGSLTLGAERVIYQIRSVVFALFCAQTRASLAVAIRLLFNQKDLLFLLLAQFQLRLSQAKLVGLSMLLQAKYLWSVAVSEEIIVNSLECLVVLDFLLVFNCLLRHSGRS